MNRKRSQHVVPSDGKWAVWAAGEKKATRIFETQGAAITVARRIARRQESELVIHARDGRIREKSAYSKEPFPPKG
jgi:hypothetical protein